MIDYEFEEIKKFNNCIIYLNSSSEFANLLKENLNEDFDNESTLIRHLKDHVLINEFDSSGDIIYEKFDPNNAKLPPYNFPGDLTKQAQSYYDDALRIAKISSFDTPNIQYDEYDNIDKININNNSKIIGFVVDYNGERKFIKAILSSSKIIPASNTKNNINYPLNKFCEFVSYYIKDNKFKISTYHLKSFNNFMGIIRRDFLKSLPQNKSENEYNNLYSDYNTKVIVYYYNIDDNSFYKKISFKKDAIDEYYKLLIDSSTDEVIYKIVDCDTKETYIPSSNANKLSKYNKFFDNLESKINVDIRGNCFNKIKNLSNYNYSEGFINSIIKILGIDFIKDATEEELKNKIDKIVDLQSDTTKKIPEENFEEIRSFLKEKFNISNRRDAIHLLEYIDEEDKTIKKPKQARFNFDDEEWPVIDYPEDDDDDYYGPYTKICNR